MVEPASEAVDAVEVTVLIGGNVDDVMTTFAVAMAPGGGALMMVGSTAALLVVGGALAVMLK